jgi:putative ABC transport system permease protein
MLSHYLVVSLRSLRRAPFITLIKLLVLGLGLTCFVVAYSLVSYWGQAERGFAKADRTFMMTTRIELSDGSDTGWQPRFDEDNFQKLEVQFPEFETLSRARSAGVMPVAAGERKTRLNASYADAEFLEIFDLPFVAGDPRAALAAPGSAVLTASAAQRLFGADDPLGRTFRYAGVADLTVTGVIGDIAQPSHIGPAPTALLRFDVLASWDVLDRVVAARRAAGGGFGMPPQLAYAVLPEGSRVTPESLAPRLEPLSALTIERDLVRYSSGMLPIRELVAKQLDSALFDGVETTVSVTTLLLALGVLVLGVACVNYVNLATAQALRRAKEVGLRKAIGAESRQIVTQHMLEAALMTAAAFALAVFIAALLGPALRSGADVDLALAFADPTFWLWMLAAIAGATLLAGAYPAFVLSRTRPMRALQSRDAARGRSTVSTLLVGVQFAAASFLSIAIFVMQQQASDLRRAALATDTDPLIVVTNTAAYTGVDSASLAEHLRALPDVTAVAGMSSPPWTDSMGPTLMTDPRDPATLRSAVSHGVDYDFFATMNLRLVAGRTFDRGRADISMWSATVDRQGALVVDESFTRMMGFASPADAVDELVYLPVADWFAPIRIVGVVEDKPLVFTGNGVDASNYYLSEQPEQILIRLDRNEVAGALAAVQRVWEQRVPTHAFEYEFEDQLFAQGYAAFARVNDAFTGLASLAYAICIIGLVGMAGHMTGRRRREIGVRKTLGATWQSVFGLLLAAFSRPVVIANVIAWPFAYLAATAYLAIFVHRVELTVWPFVVSLVVTVVVAWAAVGVQAWRAARVAPAVVLRND